MCLWDAVPECLRPDSDGLESARNVPKIVSGRKLTFTALLWRRFSLPRCQRVLAACAVHKCRTAARKALISKVLRKQ